MTIVTLSYKAATSMGKAQVAVQTTCRKFYNRFYYLTPNEQEKYEPQLETIKEKSPVRQMLTNPIIDLFYLIQSKRF